MIAKNASEKDLKCKGKRYEEWIQLNESIEDSEKLPTIERYSWVMYNAINYKWMSSFSKKYFEDNFWILSGMYGLLKPLDAIWNYKLPIETKWLYAYWEGKITKNLNNLELDYVVDLLPWSYKKMIQWSDIKANVVTVDFFHNKDGEIKKMTHGVKKVKGEYIHKLCNNSPSKLEDFPWKLEKISDNRFQISVI